MKSLTRRQIEIIIKTAQGTPLKAIAQQMNVTIAAVHQQRHKAQLITGTVNSVTLVAYCLRNKIIE